LGQFNPVSGRFSGDAQQFPKDAVLTLQGDLLKEQKLPIPDSEVLYHPRRAFVGAKYYLDYSQVELRYQAHHTLHFGGDVNLCRAYMPFKCVHHQTGELYSFDTREDRKRWIELKDGAPTDQHWEDLLKAGWSVWVVPETGKPWIPTDVHGATSLRALQTMGYDIEKMTKDELKWWRNIGKRFNFMRNYGGGDKKAAETLEIDLESAKAMNKGYSDAFPLVVTYQKAIEKAMMKKGYVQSQSGRRYYLSDSWRFYKAANYMIQGPCADILKDKMIEIDDYIEAHCADLLAMDLCVHDELQFPAFGTEEQCLPHIAAIKAIMEDTPDVKVPIVAEVEYTSDSWNNKRKVLNVG
jgi:DNA polymerase-1